MCPAKSVSVSVTVSNSADKEADVQKAACVCAPTQSSAEVVYTFPSYLVFYLCHVFMRVLW